MPTNAAELHVLFAHFDADGSGTISHEEFVQGVRDPLTPRRLALVKQAFGVLDSDGSGVVEPGEVAGRYDASKHPDVITGKKSAEEVMRCARATTRRALRSRSQSHSSSPSSSISSFLLANFSTPPPPASPASPASQSDFEL